MIRHRRETGNAIATRIVGGGTLLLEPPGIELALADTFSE